MQTYLKPDYLGQITKMLYPEIARMLNTTAARVEEAIRHILFIGSMDSWKCWVYQ